MSDQHSLLTVYDPTEYRVFARVLDNTGSPGRLEAYIANLSKRVRTCPSTREAARQELPGALNFFKRRALCALYGRNEAANLVGEALARLRIYVGFDPEDSHPETAEDDLLFVSANDRRSHEDLLLVARDKLEAALGAEIRLSLVNNY